MTGLGNCFIAKDCIVSLYCHDDDDNNCLLSLSDNNITAGFWMIGDPASDSGGVGTVDLIGDQWPYQVRDWEYDSGGLGWESDPRLTVTGNININNSCYIIIINIVILKSSAENSFQLITMKDIDLHNHNIKIPCLNY